MRLRFLHHIDRNRQQLHQSRLMTYRILKMRIGQINLSDLSCRICGKQLPAKHRRILIGGRLHNLMRRHYHMIAAALQHLRALTSDRVDVKILFLQITPCNQPNHIRIVSARQTAIRGHDNDCCTRGIPCLQIRMINIAASRQHGADGSIHIIEIRRRILRAGTRLLQLDRGHELHRVCDLLRAGDTAFSSFDVAHGSHLSHLPFIRVLHP